MAVYYRELAERVGIQADDIMPTVNLGELQAYKTHISSLQSGIAAPQVSYVKVSPPAATTIATLPAGGGWVTMDFGNVGVEWDEGNEYIQRPSLQWAFFPNFTGVYYISIRVVITPLLLKDSQSMNLSFSGVYTDPALIQDKFICSSSTAVNDNSCIWVEGITPLFVGNYYSPHIYVKAGVGAPAQVISVVDVNETSFCIRRIN